METGNKSRRRYDASRRRSMAEQRRQRILGSAQRLFLRTGYAATTVAAIADDAGVAVETVYKAFGGKPGLVRAIVGSKLLGTAEVPAETRSDAAQATEPNAAALFRRFGEFTREIAPEIAPIMRLIRDAAASGDHEMRGLLAEVEDERHARMLHNALTVAGRGFLRPDVTPAAAADVMWLYTDSRFFDDLVVARGWTPEAFAGFIAGALQSALA